MSTQKNRPSPQPRHHLLIPFKLPMSIQLLLPSLRHRHQLRLLARVLGQKLVDEVVNLIQTVNGKTMVVVALDLDPIGIGVGLKSNLLLLLVPYLPFSSMDF